MVHVTVCRNWHKLLLCGRLGESGVVDWRHGRAEEGESVVMYTTSSDDVRAGAPPRPAPAPPSCDVSMSTTTGGGVEVRLSPP